MLATEIAQEKLEAMGVKAYEELDRSLESGHDQELEYIVPQVIVIGDAYAQLNSKDKDKSRSVEMCANSLSELALKSIRLKRASPRIAKLIWLNFSKHANTLTDLREDARKELFSQNPQYHGRRTGQEYSKAVATGRLAFKS